MPHLYQVTHSHPVPTLPSMGDKGEEIKVMSLSSKHCVLIFCREAPCPPLFKALSTTLLDFSGATNTGMWVSERSLDRVSLDILS